jgi:D-serine deaminase-like pyridoxal phosphate-dependent protein
MARDALLAAGFAADVLSAGSTPTATLSAEGVVTEERPGTYVFGDRQQIALGSIPADAAGLVVAATVVSAAVPGQVVIDAGAKILARDRPDFLDGLGIVPALGGAVVERAYDYHGVVRLPEGTATPEIGTVVAVIPNHVCPVVNLVDAMHVVVDGRSVATWPVDARGLNG